MQSQFDVISFALEFVQTNTFFIYCTAAMGVLSVLFNTWIGGLFVFEYDKDNLRLDQYTREELPPNSSGGPGGSDDVFPNRDFNGN